LERKDEKKYKLIGELDKKNNNNYHHLANERIQIGKYINKNKKICRHLIR